MIDIFVLQDKIADTIINYYVDDVMRELVSVLNVEVPEYRADMDPVLMTKALRTQLDDLSDAEPIEWTIPDEWFEDPDLLEKVDAKKAIIEDLKATAAAKKSPRKTDRRKSSVKEEKKEEKYNSGANDRNQRRKRRSDLQDELYARENKVQKTEVDNDVTKTDEVFTDVCDKEEPMDVGESAQVKSEEEELPKNGVDSALCNSNENHCVKSEVNGVKESSFPLVTNSSTDAKGASSERENSTCTPEILPSSDRDFLNDEDNKNSSSRVESSSNSHDSSTNVINSKPIIENLSPNSNDSPSKKQDLPAVNNTNKVSETKQLPFTKTSKADHSSDMHSVESSAPVTPKETDASSVAISSKKEPSKEILSTTSDINHDEVCKSSSVNSSTKDSLLEQVIPTNSNKCDDREKSLSQSHQLPKPSDSSDKSDNSLLKEAVSLADCSSSTNTKTRVPKDVVLPVTTSGLEPPKILPESEADSSKSLRDNKPDTSKALSETKVFADSNQSEAKDAPDSCKTFHDNKVAPDSSNTQSKDARIPESSKTQSEPQNLSDSFSAPTKTKDVPDSSKSLLETEILPDSSKASPETKNLPDSSKASPETKNLPDSSKSLPETKNLPDSSKSLPEVKNVPDSSKASTEAKETPDSSKSLPEETNLLCSSKVVPEAETSLCSSSVKKSDCAVENSTKALEDQVSSSDKTPSNSVLSSSQ